MAGTEGKTAGIVLMLHIPINISGYLSIIHCIYSSFRNSWKADIEFSCKHACSLDHHCCSAIASQDCMHALLEIMVNLAPYCIIIFFPFILLGAVT